MAINRTGGSVKTVVPLGGQLSFTHASTEYVELDLSADSMLPAGTYSFVPQFMNAAGMSWKLTARDANGTTIATATNNTASTSVYPRFTITTTQPIRYVGIWFAGQYIYVTSTNANLYIYPGTSTVAQGVGSWTTKAALPATNVSLNTDPHAVVGTTLYIAGWTDRVNTVTTKLYAYDTVANTWTLKAAPPAATTQSYGWTGGFLLPVGTTLYMGGGNGISTSGGTLASSTAVAAYDTTNNTWATKTAGTQAFDFTSSTGIWAMVIGTNIYYKMNNTTATSFYLYSTTGNTHTALSSTGYSTNGTANIAIWYDGTYINRLAGQAGGNTTFQQYNVSGNTWGTATSASSGMNNGGFGTSNMNFGSSPMLPVPTTSGTSYMISNANANMPSYNAAPASLAYSPLSATPSAASTSWTSQTTSVVYASWATKGPTNPILTTPDKMYSVGNTVYVMSNASTVHHYAYDVTQDPTPAYLK